MVIDPDLALIGIDSQTLAIWGETDHVVLELSYDRLRHSFKHRLELDRALKRLIDRKVIEVAISDDFEAGTKTMTVYRHGCAPEGSILVGGDAD